MEKEVPKLFLQPLVENAIVHGFKNSEEKGILEISAETGEENISLLEKPTPLLLV